MKRLELRLIRKLPRNTPASKMKASYLSSFCRTTSINSLKLRKLSDHRFDAFKLSLFMAYAPVKFTNSAWSSWFILAFIHIPQTLSPSYRWWTSMVDFPSCTDQKYTHFVSQKLTFVTLQHLEEFDVCKIAKKKFTR